MSIKAHSSDKNIDSVLPDKMLSGRVLARNSIWNFAGLAAPMVVALVTIPMVIHGLGKDRYGLLGIIWMAIGYFGLFDMGLGRALTKFVAEYLGRGRNEEVPNIIWTALWLMLGLSVIGMVAGIVVARPLICHVLNVPPALQGEGVTSFVIASVCIPVVIVTAAVMGILEAYQKFAVITLVRIPLGIMTYLGPLISLLFTRSLVGATSVLAVTRVVAMIAYFACVLRVIPELRHPVKAARGYVGKLFSFGGWITVSNIIGPLMTYMDRFFVGSILTMTAVTYYTTPYNVLSNLQMVPQAIMGVLFPALTAALSGERQRLAPLYGRTSHTMFLLMLPLTGFFFLFAPELLQLWLGRDFRIAATIPTQLLAFGWMINTFARPSSTILQSTGRPDFATKVYICEILPYWWLLYHLTLRYGIVGTALAWLLRVVVDTILFSEITRRVLPDLTKSIHQTYCCILGCVVLFAVFWLAVPLPLRIALFLAVAIGSGVFLWPMVRVLLCCHEQDSAASTSSRM